MRCSAFLANAANSSVSNWPSVANDHAVLAREAERRMHEFNAQDLANTAWAFGTLGQLDALLFAALARVAERHMHEFNAQNLANTVWAFATLG